MANLEHTVRFRDLRERRRPAAQKRLLRQIYNERLTYALLLPAMLATALFAYWPIYGILLAFKNFRISRGIIGSPWMDTYGLGWFRIMFRDPDFLRVTLNTIRISFIKIVLGTFFCITVALLLTELRNRTFARIIQSVMYLPYFLSWVVMAGLVYGAFSTTGGFVPKLLEAWTSGQTVQILANPKYFRLLVYSTDLWKGVGFGTIIYLAAIAGVNPELYESAIMDGAGRFRLAVSITLPMIKSTIVLLLILELSKLMNGGFDQILNLYSPQVLGVGDIIDTYVYRHGVLGLEFSYSTAIDLFKQVINIVLLVIVNNIARLMGEEGVY